jgi:hypothetical protein
MGVIALLLFVVGHAGTAASIIANAMVVEPPTSQKNA